MGTRLVGVTQDHASLEETRIEGAGWPGRVAAISQTCHGGMHKTHRAYKHANDQVQNTGKIQHPESLPSKPRGVGQNITLEALESL